MMSSLPDAFLELWLDLQSTVSENARLVGGLITEFVQVEMERQVEDEVDELASPEERSPFVAVVSSPLARQLLMLSPALMLGGMPGFDIGVSSGALFAMQQSGLLASPGAEALVASASMLGSLVMSSLVFALEGTPESEPSPKSRMVWGACCYAIGALFTSLSFGAPGVIVGRLVSGAGIAMVSIGAPQYLSETTSSQYRGQLFGVKQTVLTLLMLTGSTISMSTVIFAGPSAWRLIFDVCGCIGAVGAASGATLLPESPRWLLRKRKPIAAAEVFSSFHGLHASEREFAQMQEHVEYDAFNRTLDLNELFRQPSLLPAVLAVCATQLSGHPAMMVHLTNILSHTHLGVEDMTRVGMAILLWKSLSTLVVLPLVDSGEVGRYGLIRAGSVLLVVSLVELGVSQSAHSSIGMILGLFLNASIFQASFGTLVWLLPSELLPNHCRARGLALTRIVDYTCFATTAAGLPILSAEFGVAAPYFVAASFAVCTAGPLLMLLPETANQSLEDVQQSYETKDAEGALRLTSSDAHPQADDMSASSGLSIGASR